MLGVFSVTTLSFLVYHSKCVDEWLMKWNRVCPVCKRVILRNERGEDQVEADEHEPASAEAQTSPIVSSADNISDSRTVESIPLLVTLHESTEGRQSRQRYGSVAEGNSDMPNAQYLLESFTTMQNNNTLPQPQEEPAESNNNSLATDLSDTV